MYTKQYFVYFLTNYSNKVLYIGVTNDLLRRIYEHKQKLVPGFTGKYNLAKLVHYEVFDDVQEAIKREKYLKGKRRSFKDNLIRKLNPKLEDLYTKLSY